MLDKLSIEDIKASVTELMAGGVDTVPNDEFGGNKWILGSDFLNFLSKRFCVRLSDLHHSAVDVV